MRHANSAFISATLLSFLITNGTKKERARERERDKTDPCRALAVSASSSDVFVRLTSSRSLAVTQISSVSAEILS